MANTTKSNYMTNFLLGTIRKSTSKELFHKCPYQGRIVISNATMQNEKFFSIYPPGKYRINVKLLEEDNVEKYSAAMEIVLSNWVKWKCIKKLIEKA